MTFLGKIFTGIIFVLSIGFFFVSLQVLGTHIDHKALADQKSKAADKANQEKRALEEKLEQLKREYAIEQMARRTALASLQTQYSQISNELSGKETQLRDLQSAHTLASAAEKTLTETLKARSDENELLREHLKSKIEERNQLYKKVVDATDSRNRLQGDHDRLLERYSDLVSSSTLAMEKLQALGIKPDTDLGVPAANGLVVAVATDGTVEVNLGQDDGLKPNTMLDVHRNGEYIGKVMVTKVTANAAIGQILTSYQKGYIRAGDRVDTKLY
ncbi:MAG: hypothetical protein U0930_17800 [Pirellulales bacterium]